jgi:hypothetical protein
MEHPDQELIERLCLENEELRTLLREHEAFERKLSDYAERRYLTDVERGEVARLKKLKLAGKDRIEMILAPARGLQG